MGLVVVIPAYREPWLLRSLMSLKKCQLPLCDVEVLVVINGSTKDSAATRTINETTYQQVLDWSAKNSTSRLRFYAIYVPDLPPKYAGVGVARKTGMDEACYRFEKIRQKQGIIACFDADSRCLPNYLAAVYQHFQKNPKTAACSIYFEHPVRGAEFDRPVYEAIVAYELHLRYFINAQAWAGCPFAFQTIGSSMAVRADYYQQQGGMNKRKAGEDFYFLQKFIALGKVTNLTSTTVFPSPRISDRVPFGTGKAVGEWSGQPEEWQTYHPDTFGDLKIFLKKIPKLAAPDADDWEQGLPESVVSFLKSVDFTEHLQEIRTHTSSRQAFRKRFFRWFNAFLVMKFAHYCRDNFYPNLPVTEAANWLAEKLSITEQPHLTAKDLLLKFRTFDRKAGFF